MKMKYENMKLMKASNIAVSAMKTNESVKES